MVNRDENTVESSSFSANFEGSGLSKTMKEKFKYFSVVLVKQFWIGQR